LKIFLKDTVYRYAYYLIGAAWLFTLSFIFSNYWSYTSSPQGVKKTLQQNLNKQEKDFEDFIKDSSLIARLVNTQESVNEVEDLIEKKYGIFIYKLEDYGPINLKYWNTQQTLPTDEMLVKLDGEYMESLPNGQFELIRRKVSINETNLLVCALIPIRWDYFIENDYLKKGFIDQPNIEKNYRISATPTDIPIINLSGNPLFYLEKKTNSGTGGSDWITILLRILGTMLILFYIHMLGLGMARRFGPVKA